MRFPAIYAVVFLSLICACNKDEISGPQTLQGQWRLVTISDKNTNITYFRPGGSSGDVIINFRGDQFSGNTLRNTFSDGSFSLSGNTDLTFGDYTTTKIAEDEWGGMFATVLTACRLQSVTPCSSSRISFEGNKLLIQSPLRYDLTLVRN